MLHPVAICGPQGSRDERHEHGWRDQGDWFQRSATCSLSQQCRWLSRHLFHSTSSIMFHYIPLCSIHFHYVSFYFKLYPMISHLIPLIWIQHDGNWQNIIIHYPHMSTFLFYVVLFFWFYSSISVYHPPIQFVVFVVTRMSCSWLFWSNLRICAEGCRRFDYEFWIILIYFDSIATLCDIPWRLPYNAKKCHKLPIIM